MGTACAHTLISASPMTQITKVCPAKANQQRPTNDIANFIYKTGLDETMD